MTTHRCGGCREFVCEQCARDHVCPEEPEFGAY